MRAATIICAVLGVALIAFGYWGVETRGGQRMFDEMAGMIPLGIGVLGALILLGALVAAVIDLRRG